MSNHADPAQPEPSDRDLLQRWRAEERPQPEGWDFSSLATRMSEDEDPWDLRGQYRRALAGAQHVLDMGTGGGEFLKEFVDVLPQDTVGTEGWPPNLAVAQRNLSAYGIEVVEYGAPDHGVDSVRMPFPDNRFDLVLNRHESFSPTELARVLRPGGVFLTQQVSGHDQDDLQARLGHRLSHPHVTYSQLRADLEAAGFEVVDGAEHTGWYQFDDVAALVAYLQLATWEPPDVFTVERYADRLLELHRASAGGSFRAARRRFWLKAIRAQ